MVVTSKVFSNEMSVKLKLSNKKQMQIYNKTSEILCTMIWTYLCAMAITSPCPFHTITQCKYKFRKRISPVFFPRPYTVFNNIFNFWVFHFLKAHGFHSLKKKLRDQLTHKNVKCIEHLHPPLKNILTAELMKGRICRDVTLHQSINMA